MLHKLGNEMVGQKAKMLTKMIGSLSSRPQPATTHITILQRCWEDQQSKDYLQMTTDRD